jgi:hypothetical protein
LITCHLGVISECLGHKKDSFLAMEHLQVLDGFNGSIQITESDAVDVVETILKDVRVTPITQAFALTALLKLSSRFPQCTEYALQTSK